MSHLSNSQGVGNKRGGGAKTPELINEKGGIFGKRTSSQCPRANLNKRFLPRSKTTTAWKLKSARIEIPHIGTHYIEFSKTDFYYNTKTALQ